MHVVLFVADGCGLCRDACETVASVCGELDTPFEVSSIDGDDELERRYRVSLPVVEINGVRRFEFFVDEHDLRRAITGA